MTAAAPLDSLIVPDAQAWQQWLLAHAENSAGTWLVLAKKGVTSPTSLTYQQALEEALCDGWIDGQRRSRDAHTFLQRFTPRRPSSLWSQRNVAIVARLAEQGRLRERGLAEIERARADGRWERAYAGSATAETPAELRAALAQNPAAEAAFAALSRADRYQALHPILIAANDGVRRARIAALVSRLT